MSEKKSSTVRSLYWATIVYPESAPEHWKNLLSDAIVPALISPLHDKDINPTGELKKDHYHVILMYDSLKSSNQAKEIIDIIGGVGCERVNSIRGYARYLCHLDNPEKYRYNEDDVSSLCGVDYFNLINLPTDNFAMIIEIMDWCDENEIFGFASLLRYSRVHRSDWFRLLCSSGTYVIKEYLKSAKWEFDNK